MISRPCSSSSSKWTVVEPVVVRPGTARLAAVAGRARLSLSKPSSDVRLPRRPASSRSAQSRGDRFDRPATTPHMLLPEWAWQCGELTRPPAVSVPCIPHNMAVSSKPPSLVLWLRRLPGRRSPATRARTTIAGTRPLLSSQFRVTECARIGLFCCVAFCRWRCLDSCFFSWRVLSDCFACAAASLIHCVSDAAVLLLCT